MGRMGRTKHQKRLCAPKAWMLDKLSGVFAPKVQPGPHKTRECLPLSVILRNRLKYALTYKETMSILMQRLVKVDGKVKTQQGYPAGFMDVLSLDKSDEHFRLIYDPKGRFVLHRISADEAQYKLCRVRSKKLGEKGVPCVGLHDARTVRYPDPLVSINDTVVLDIATNKIKDWIKFEVGNMCMITGGRNAGRVGTIVHHEKHKGSHDIVQVKDTNGHLFSTRIANIFVIGKGNKPLVSLPKTKGVRLSILEEQELKYEGKKYMEEAA